MGHSLHKLTVFPLHRYFQFHCTSSGRRLGGYLCTSWCTCLDYDSGARYVFIGDYSGMVARWL